MSSQKSSRKLAAILFADVVGYTKLMQKDESAASVWLRRFQDDLNESIPSYNGTIINFYGDGALCTFENPLEAIRCAIALQSGFQDDPTVPVRIGIHSGTVVTEGDKVYGDSVNIASRIESMGIPGAILVSKKVRDELKNQPDLLMPSLGSFEFKNVEEPMEVFALANEGFAVPKRDEIRGKVTKKIKPKNKILLPLLAAIVILIGGGYYFLGKNGTSATTVIDTIAIFPFDIKSGNPEIQYLSNGMVDLISTKLGGVPNLTPIDPNRIFNQLSKSEEEVPVLETATEISSALGAAEFILGSIIEINDAFQISASKYNSKGTLITKESIEGQKTQLATLIDDLTRAFIADKLEKEGQELNSIAIMTSENLPA
ncbi:MAG: adenylate/guanylate cyclase domain-containing protein, partial [Bacteroidia bacterium]|nr:adenylate/guanylate cyclase domain-containing protein [Bacteroidia bacterium]